MSHAAGSDMTTKTIMKDMARNPIARSETP